MVAGPISESHALQRDQANQSQSYTLPDFQRAVQRLAVDGDDHVWLVADDQRWRLSPSPDFTLIAPATWLLASARSRQGQITLHGTEGYSSIVALTAIDPPDAINITIEPNSLSVGQVAQRTLTAVPGSLPATHHLLIQASDNVADPHRHADDHRGGCVV